MRHRVTLTCHRRSAHIPLVCRSTCVPHLSSSPDYCASRSWAPKELASSVTSPCNSKQKRLGTSAASGPKLVGVVELVMRLQHRQRRAHAQSVGLQLRCHDNAAAAKWAPTLPQFQCLEIGGYLRGSTAFGTKISACARGGMRAPKTRCFKNIQRVVNLLARSHCAIRSVCHVHVPRRDELHKQCTPHKNDIRHAKRLSLENPCRHCRYRLRDTGLGRLCLSSSIIVSRREPHAEIIRDINRVRPSGTHKYRLRPGRPVEVTCVDNV